MATFAYQEFDTQYTKMAKLIGMEETDDSTIVGVVNATNTSIKEDLDYAAGAAWAASKLTSWDEFYADFQNKLMELQNLLTVAKQTRDAREAWDQQQANQGIVSQG